MPRIDNDQWRGRHEFDDFIVRDEYYVYASDTSTTSTPFFIRRGIIILTKTYSSEALSSRVPFSVTIQVNDGRVYSFSGIGSNGAKKVKEYKGSEHMLLSSDADDFYFVSANSATTSVTYNIPLPFSGEEVVIKTVITDKNGVEYRYEEHAAGLFPGKIGDLSIYDDTTANYKTVRKLTTGCLHRVALTNTLNVPDYSIYVDDGAPSSSRCYLESSYTYSLKQAQSDTSATGYAITGYADADTPSILMANRSCNALYLAPMYTGNYYSQEDTKAKLNIRLYRMTMDENFGSNSWETSKSVYIRRTSNQITLASYSATFTISAAEGVQDILAPELGQAAQINTKTQEQIDKYGGVAHGEPNYHYSIRYGAVTNRGSELTTMYCGMPYGAYLRSAVVKTTNNGTVTEEHAAISTATSLTAGYTSNSYDYYTSFKSVSGQTDIEYTLLDNFGRIYTHTDHLTVLPYHEPVLTKVIAHRARPAKAGDAAESIITAGGSGYVFDEYGEYGIVEWGCDVSPLNNQNEATVQVSGSYTQNGVRRFIDAVRATPESYTGEGYCAFPANTECSYDLTVSLKDDFHTVYAKIVLDSALTIMDYRNGGNGVGLGKVAELDMTVEVRADWDVLFPNTVTVENYDLQNHDIDFVTWIIAKRDYIRSCYPKLDIYIFSARYSNQGVIKYGVTGVTALTADTVIGRAVTETDYRTDYIWIPKDPSAGSTGTIRYGAAKINEPIQKLRDYLHFILSGATYIYMDNPNASSGQILGIPMIYLTEEEPTGLTADHKPDTPSGTYLSVVAMNTTLTNLNEPYQLTGKTVMAFPNTSSGSVWITFVFCANSTDDYGFEIRNLYETRLSS